MARATLIPAKKILVPSYTPSYVKLNMTESEARYLLLWIDERAPKGWPDGPVMKALRSALGPLKAEELI